MSCQGFCRFLADQSLWVIKLRGLFVYLRHYRQQQEMRKSQVWNCHAVVMTLFWLLHIELSKKRKKKERSWGRVYDNVTVMSLLHVMMSFWEWNLMSFQVLRVHCRHARKRTGLSQANIEGLINREILQISFPSHLTSLLTSSPQKEKAREMWVTCGDVLCLQTISSKEEKAGHYKFQAWLECIHLPNK
jgi:hypothetical protein